MGPRVGRYRLPRSSRSSWTRARTVRSSSFSLRTTLKNPTVVISHMAWASLVLDGQPPEADPLELPLVGQVLDDPGARRYVDLDRGIVQVQGVAGDQSTRGDLDGPDGAIGIGEIEGVAVEGHPDRLHRTLWRGDLDSERPIPAGDPRHHVALPDNGLWGVGVGVLRESPPCVQGLGQGGRVAHGAPTRVHIAGPHVSPPPSGQQVGAVYDTP